MNSDLRVPTQKERFKWFALSHFAISILGVAGMFLCTLLDGALLAALFLWEPVLLALYLFAGRWSALRRNWDRPQSLREGFRAFLSPTLVAWTWGGLFLVMLFLVELQRGLGDAVDMIAIFLMYSLLFLAFPSSLGFIMLMLFVGGLDVTYTLVWPWLVVFMLIVGAVPPALFLLGGIWGGRKNEKNGEASDETLE